MRGLERALSFEHIPKLPLHYPHIWFDHEISQSKTTGILTIRDAHFSPGPQFPASPSPFGEFVLGKNGEMGRDGDENHPQIEMGMGGDHSKYVNVLSDYYFPFVYVFEVFILFNK